MHSKNIVISGAGIVGMATAIGLAQMGHKVKVYEKRENANKSSLPLEKRSLKLDISYRGQLLLHKLGVMEDIKKHSIILNKRVYHTNQGNLVVDTDIHQLGFFSISHSKIWEILFEKSKLYTTIEIVFGVEAVSFDNDGNTLELYNSTFHRIFTEKFDLLFVCDGVNSKIRESLKDNGIVLFRERMFGGEYKEIRIFDPKNHLDLNSTHFWFNKAGIMLVVHPTTDKPLEGHLFLDKNLNTEYEFDNLNSARSVEKFFTDRFMGLTIDPMEIISSPVGRTKMIDQIKIRELNSKVFFIGDSMHSMVPFLGQGVNCGLEDSHVLLQKIESEENDSILNSYYHETRIMNANALVEMSLKNAPEFAGDVFDNKVMINRFLDNYLKHYYKWYVPFVDLIYFSNIQFHYIKQIRDIQREFLNSISVKYMRISDIDYSFVHKVIKDVKKDLMAMYAPIKNDIYNYAAKNLKLR